MRILQHPEAPYLATSMAAGDVRARPWPQREWSQVPCFCLRHNVGQAVNVQLNGVYNFFVCCFIWIEDAVDKIFVFFWSDYMQENKLRRPLSLVPLTGADRRSLSFALFLWFFPSFSIFFPLVLPCGCALVSCPLQDTSQSLLCLHLLVSRATWKCPQHTSNMVDKRLWKNTQQHCPWLGSSEDAKPTPWGTYYYRLSSLPCLIFPVLHRHLGYELESSKAMYLKLPIRNWAISEDHFLLSQHQRTHLVFSLTAPLRRPLILAMVINCQDPIRYTSIEFQLHWQLVFSPVKDAQL
jgi:hypothetical protein